MPLIIQFDTERICEKIIFSIYYLLIHATIICFVLILKKAFLITINFINELLIKYYLIIMYFQHRAMLFVSIILTYI